MMIIEPPPASAPSEAAAVASVPRGFAIVDSVLGALALARTPRGVCLLEFLTPECGPQAFRERLQARYPGCAPMAGDPAAQAMALAVAAWLAACAAPRHPAPALPLDLHGTDFQTRVWAQLRQIPAGETRTYGEIAAAIGRPGAARAVGSACAANPVAVLVPCHRALGRNGRLTGFRWGIERKAHLLAREQRPAGAARARPADAAHPVSAPAG